jgi:DNA adenine methylase
MECKNAVDLIKQADSEDTLVYADPPYFNSICKPYIGRYSEHDFRELLETLASMKGRFLLSSYPSDLLDLYAKKYGWHQKAIVQPISVNRTKTGKNRKKVEVLTANYPLQ